MSEIPSLGVSRHTMTELFHSLECSVQDHFWHIHLHLLIVWKMIILLRDRIGTFLFIFVITDWVWRPFIKIKLVHEERLPREGRVLCLATHRHFFGTFPVEGKALAPWILTRQWMLPVNVAKQRVYPWILRGLGKHFGVHPLPGEEDKTGRDRIYQMLLSAFKQPDAMVFLFPTGKIDAKGQCSVSHFRKGVGRLIIEGRPDCIVFVHDNDTQQLKLRMPFWKRPRSEVIYSHPLPLARLEEGFSFEGDLETRSYLLTRYLEDLFTCWVACVDQKMFGCAYEVLASVELNAHMKVLLNGDA